MGRLDRLSRASGRFLTKCPFAQPVGASTFDFMLRSKGAEGAVVETRKLAAILAADIVGYSRLAGSDEDRTLARLRTLRSDLIDPTIAVHNGRMVKRTGDGIIVEFRSVVDAVRCAIEMQNGVLERNAGVPSDRRIEFRMGVHIGDVVEESDGDLMGGGVNIAARLEGIAKPGAICLSEDAYRQVSTQPETVCCSASLYSAVWRNVNLMSPRVWAARSLPSYFPKPRETQPLKPRSG
jgi:class 3 adenylate cyclase